MKLAWPRFGTPLPDDGLRGRSGPTESSGDTRLLHRVRWTLVAWSGAITLVILLALGSAIYLSVASSLQATGTQTLRARADTIHDAIVYGSAVPGARFPVRIGFDFGGPAPGTYAMIIGPNGSVLGAPEAVSGLPDSTGVAAARASGTDLQQTTLDGEPVWIFSESAQTAGQTYVVQVVGSRAAEQRTLDILLGVLGIGGLAALLLALAAGTIYASRALVPIRDSLRRQREFAADASHELRTPLSIVRTSLDYLRHHSGETIELHRETLDDIGTEVDHLTGLVDSLLVLARADSGALEIASEPVDLADVAASALGGLGPLAESRAISLTLDAEPAQVQGDPLRLRQLVTILADNAIRYGHGGGNVVVRVQAAGHTARLDVEDDGPGIPPEFRERVFERFWRAPGAAPGGTGLGLSIASWIVAQHGGTISLEERPGGGSRFVVQLGVAAS